jgi:uncharacterized protein YkwD
MVGRACAPFGIAICAAVVASADDGIASPAPPSTAWVAASESPLAIASRDMSDRETDLLAHCGAGEEGLRRAAMRVVDHKLRGLSYLDLDGLAFAQRAAGEPHVWPRAWIVSGRALDHDSVLRKLDAWRASFHDIGERRCGVAIGVARDGTEVVAAVALDALADLAPLPTRARAGQWLTIDARMLVPATGASVIVLGPSGAPRAVPTSFSDGRVRAKIAADRPGAFTVQVVADVETGPRPVLEASVFAETEPPADARGNAAPGEEAATSDGGDASLLHMLQAMRRAEHLPSFSRDRDLDALALAHARLMAQARTLGHDVGDGDPSLRMSDAGLTPRDAGENVAHSPTAALAHRALYASPSHRSNLLRADFDRIGVAVVADPDGSVWVDEVFASGL